jgi:hypothetical protein
MSQKILAVDPGINGGWALGDGVEISSLNRFYHRNRVHRFFNFK